MKRRFVSREKLELPKLSLLALPNVILILLFFFVMLTHVRNDQVRVGKVKAPQATELSKMNRGAIVTTIYIGKPDGKKGTIPHIQLNDQMLTVVGVEKQMKQARAALKADQQSLMTVLLKVDKDTPMGIVSDVKQALRRANVLNIVYSACPEQ